MENSTFRRFIVDRSANMERDMKNKTALVTGGAEGIGFQITKQFIKSEAKLVIILDINDQNGNNAVTELTATFGSNKVVFFKCNVVKDLKEIYQKIINEFGTIDILVNNAGIADEEVPENCIDVNLTATVKWSIHFTELMRVDTGGKGGTIINISSVFGYRVDNFVPVYTATKFGVVGFTKALGHEKNYNKKQVRVIGICPGFTYTNLTKPFQENQSCEHINKDYQWQTPEEVADKVGEVFKIADSGSVWEIEGGVLREVK